MSISVLPKCPLRRERAIPCPSHWKDSLANMKNYTRLSYVGAVFSLYVAAMATKFPERIAEFMSIKAVIAKASQKYQWPSWAVYDQNFRQEAAGNPSQSWAKVNLSFYAQCFTGQALSKESWCMKCHSPDHTSAQPIPSKGNDHGVWQWVQLQIHHMARWGSILQCIHGDCKVGRECRFLHACSSCKESHPVSRYPKRHKWKQPCCSKPVKIGISLCNRIVLDCEQNISC